MVTLRHPPTQLFGEVAAPRGNYLRFRLGPDQVAIAVGARSKKPGSKMEGEEIELYVCDKRDDEAQAYERLIGDAMKGDATLFAREDGVEEAWRIIDPVLGTKKPVYHYEPGSWGPTEAARMAAAFGGWHDPEPPLGR
jgi:glucose-6-phosphate 1-dehydrogenase